jgi:hypothetical protein
MSQHSETAMVALNRMLTWMVPLIILCAVGVWWYENRKKEAAAPSLLTPTAGQQKARPFLARDPNTGQLTVMMPDPVTGEPVDLQTMLEKQQEEVERQLKEQQQAAPSFAPVPGTGLKAKK